jgi:hypothetical protein
MPSILSDYISKNMSILDLKKELSRLRAKYNKETGHNLFIYAADFNKARQGIDVSLMQDDFYTIQDILRESCHNQIDVYIETPGGSGEAAEEIARFLHSKFDEVNFVIAGEAKSAGTILVMCANNIYMCSTGSLGPIDAQIKIGRSIVSAHDYKTWVEDKRKEAEIKGKLNPFDALLVSQISPGEIYGVVNSLDFAKDLVKAWLPKYKFRNWVLTETQKKPVTQEMKEKRASEISEKLCNHMDWHTHGRSLKMEDLKEELLIEDIDQNPQLADIVYRIKTVIRLIFDTSTDFKLYFWEDCELARSANVANVPFGSPIPAKNAKNIEVIELGVPCPKCQKSHKIKGYVDLSSDEIKNLKLPISPLIKENEILVCDTPGCGMSINIKPIKNMVENQLKKKITLY